MGLSAFSEWAAGRRRLLPGRLWLIGGTAAIVTAADALASATLTELSYRPVAWDALVYWEALGRPDPYASSQVGVIGSYLYSPAFLLLLAPLAITGWHGFLFVLTGVLAACAVWLSDAVPVAARPWWPVLGFLAVADIWAGNVHLPLTVAIVLGVRSGPAWAGVALTKVTPAVGVLWHVVRRDWRAVRAAAVAFVLVVGASLVVGIEPWLGWFAMLTAQGDPVGFALLPLPLPIRLVAAALVLAWAAAHDRPWVVPLGCLLAMPAIWPTGLVMVMGAVALAPPDAGRAAVRRPGAARSVGATAAR